MDAVQRAPYSDRCKEEKIMTSRQAAEKLTCTGMPVSQLEKEKLDHENKERLMKRDIETTISRSVKNDGKSKQFHTKYDLHSFTMHVIGMQYYVCKFVA